jgi:hypothetical protein
LGLIKPLKIFRYPSHIRDFLRGTDNSRLWQDSSSFSTLPGAMLVLAGFQAKRGGLKAVSLSQAGKASKVIGRAHPVWPEIEIYF